ncbi:unnamed protein product [Periconia digitata]|uniref:Uncharacterized protein n=1 Tax=Periconia digitata TaxID=1303443 RepID=A0A9W4URH9_9PLEO|nr:unnamed protein product [Periconia digitata]
MVRVGRSSRPSGSGFWYTMCHWLYLPRPNECDAIARLGLKSRGWGNVLFDTVLPFLCFGVILAAILLGFLRQNWGLKNVMVGKIEIDEELQLVIIGVVNKSLDVLIQAALEHMALLYNTLWMIQPGVGSTIQDTLLKNEMSKPWKALYAFYRRGRILGFWKWRSIFRLLLTLAVSISVMLLGAGLNTIAWPKRRWYPDLTIIKLTEKASPDFSIHAPLMTLDRVDWGNDMHTGVALVGGTPQTDEDGVPLLTSGAADEIAGAIAASGALMSLTGLSSVYYRESPDWGSVWDAPAYMTGIQTQINGSTVRSISLQSKHIKTLFESQKTSGNPLARTARGFHGVVRMTAPVLATTCAELKDKDVDDNSLDVQAPEPNRTTFSILVGTSNVLGFAGAQCTLTLSQALVPVETWIVDLQADNPYMAINNIAAPTIPRTLPISTNPADSLIAARLAAHFKSITPMLNGQVPAFGITPHLALIARNLKTQYPDFISDTASLTPVIATLAQQQLSTSTWTFTTHDSTTIASAPVQWQVYGSGPRLNWQWIAIAVLCIMLLVIIQHLFLILAYRIQPGSWLEPGGMLRTANKSPRVLDSVAKVHDAGSLSQREAVAKCADDGVLYQVQDIPDQWPVLIEKPVVDGWDTKRTKQTKVAQDLSDVELSSVSGGSGTGVGGGLGTPTSSGAPETVNTTITGTGNASVPSQGSNTTNTITSSGNAAVSLQQSPV